MDELDSPEIERHLAFWNYVQTFTSVAKEYGELKEKLSQRYPNDIGSYIEGKQQLTMEIEQQALIWNLKLQG
jgi:GrpB-like predicted nucleotidyltransferase (UPF0157 family)